MIEVVPCWHCNYPVAENWRYCPSCGLWLLNAPPIRTMWLDGKVFMTMDARR